MSKNHTGLVENFVQPGSIPPVVGQTFQPAQFGLRCDRLPRRRSYKDGIKLIIILYVRDASLTEDQIVLKTTL